MTPEEIASLHIDTYGYHPDDCSLCKQQDPLYVLQKLETGATEYYMNHN